MTYALDLIFPGAVIARVLASGFGSAGTMLAYAHFAGDKVWSTDVVPYSSRLLTFPMR
eukprot:SAG31_NODE_1591_length_7814_cov_4.501453_3_plen_58_part_00